MRKKLGLLLLVAFSSAAQALTWQNVSALGNASVNVLMADQPRVLYVGTQAQGVFVSKDLGATWKSLGLHNQVISDLKMDDVHQQLYAVTANALMRYVSSTWDILYQGPNYDIGQPTNIQIYQGQVYAGGMLKGLYRFNLNERNWQQVGAATWPKGEVADTLIFDASGNIFAGTSDLGVYEYTQGRWQAMNQGVQGLAVKFAFDTKQNLYLATTQGVYCFEQGVWQQVGAKSWSQGENAYALAFDAKGDVFAIGNGGLFEFVQSKKAWQKLDTSSFPSQNLHSLVYVNGRLFVGTGQGLFFAQM